MGGHRVPWKRLARGLSASPPSCPPTTAVRISRAILTNRRRHDLAAHGRTWGVAEQCLLECEHRGPSRAEAGRAGRRAVGRSRGPHLPGSGGAAGGAVQAALQGSRQDGQNLGLRTLPLPHLRPGPSSIQHTLPAAPPLHVSLVADAGLCSWPRPRPAQQGGRGLAGKTTPQGRAGPPGPAPAPAAGPRRPPRHPTRRRRRPPRRSARAPGPPPRRRGRPGPPWPGARGAPRPRSRVRGPPPGLPRACCARGAGQGQWRAGRGAGVWAERRRGRRWLASGAPTYIFYFFSNSFSTGLLGQQSRRGAGLGDSPVLGMATGPDPGRPEPGDVGATARAWVMLWVIWWKYRREGEGR